MLEAVAFLNSSGGMDWDTCNHKKLNQFQVEAKRWKQQTSSNTPTTHKKGQRTQPTKRKKRVKR